jgi:hypothetical protein
MALLKGSARVVAQACSAARLALLVLLVWTAPAVSAEAATLREYQVKAVFLLNFARFVEWPPEAFAGPQAPLVIGVLGDDPFGDYLDETVRGEKVNDRPFVVQRYHHVEEMDGCHVLFISRSEAGRLDSVLAALKGRSILTVSDMDGFAQNGGMIRLVTENNRIRLRINVDAADAARLTISSKLLRLAKIVVPGKD